MRNILITGGYGFIGSEVVNVAFTQNPSIERIVVIDKIDYCSREENILPEVRNDSRYKFIQGDICDFELIESILKEYKIDVVIHMAAQSHVDLSFTNSLQFTRDNVLGTHTLLEACRKYGKLERFLHMSTDEVYGEVSHEEETSCTENSILNPTNPYAATKAGAEFIVRSYGHSYKLPYVIVRGNNGYGPGQFPDKLIPKFIMHLHHNKRVTIHGSGTSKRTFIHVTDMAQGILTVANKGKNGEIYNIGSSNEYSVMEITQILCDLMKKDFNSSIDYVADRNFNDRRYFINHGKISSLGWNEEIPFHEGLVKTIKWYLDRADEFKDRI